MESCNGGNLDWELGKWYSVKGEIEICVKGLHLTRTPERWINDPLDRVFIAEAKNIAEWKKDKCVCPKARIILEVPRTILAKYKPEWDALDAKYNSERDALYAKYNSERDGLNQKMIRETLSEIE
jgi:hypothetical protein